MEQTPDYTYTIDCHVMPYEAARFRVSRWSKRLQIKTGKRVFYRITTHKVEIWHGEMKTKDRNKAVNSLANILNRLMGYN